MLNAWFFFFFVPSSGLESQAKKDDGLLGVVTLLLQHGALALVVLWL